MPASEDPQTAEHDVRLKELRHKYPGAEVWYVPGSDGHTEWILRLHADSPGHLEEALRDTAADGGWVTPG